MLEEIEILKEQNEILRDIAKNIKSVNVKTDKMILLLKTSLNKIDGGM